MHDNIINIIIMYTNELLESAIEKYEKKTKPDQI